jgi:Holliday junction resolvasome RuvABC endonuclease subunit
MIIGIDPSINSTGVCVWDNRKSKHIYYLIPSKMTKKMQSFSHPNIHLTPYDKIDVKDRDYSEKEEIKFDNIYKICKNIGMILDRYMPTQVYMEGVSYGSMGSAALVDLCFLNACIRMELKKRDIRFSIVSPTSLKKFACANGQVEKDVIIDAWKRLDPTVARVDSIKIDDLADSYFLAHYIKD